MMGNELLELDFRQPCFQMSGLTRRKGTVFTGPLAASSLNIRKLLNVRHKTFIMHSMDIRLINIPMPLTY